MLKNLHYSAPKILASDSLRGCFFDNFLKTHHEGGGLSANLGGDSPSLLFWIFLRFPDVNSVYCGLKNGQRGASKPLKGAVITKFGTMKYQWDVLSPIDGRYADATKSLRSYFSEFALMRYRVHVEIQYFLALVDKKVAILHDFPSEKRELVEKIAADFDEKAMTRIKKFEQTTRHDIKAVEYYIKERIIEADLGKYKEFIHIGLTSQDINNTSIPMSLRDAYKGVLRPSLEALIDQLKGNAKDWQDIMMLARTHGQPATPTYLGREIEVFVVRLEAQLAVLDKIPFHAKFGGATGGMYAHQYIDNQQDWHAFAEAFVKKLDLVRSYPTTQIEHYDHLAAFFDGWGRISTILIDYARDMWQYISMDYFSLKQAKGQIGSSAMPHKVNPIDFENAEGNLGLARAIGRHFSEKLPISRLQRDLSDSTVLRNIGVHFGHILLALQGLQAGTKKVKVDVYSISKDVVYQAADCGSESSQVMWRADPSEQDPAIASGPYERIQRLFGKLRKKLDQKRHKELAGKLAEMETAKIIGIRTDGPLARISKDLTSAVQRNYEYAASQKKQEEEEGGKKRKKEGAKKKK